MFGTLGVWHWCAIMLYSTIVTVLQQNSHLPVTPLRFEWHNMWLSPSPHITLWMRFLDGFSGTVGGQDGVGVGSHKLAMGGSDADRRTEGWTERAGGDGVEDEGLRMTVDGLVDALICARTFAMVLTIRLLSLGLLLMPLNCPPSFWNISLWYGWAS